MRSVHGYRPRPLIAAPTWLNPALPVLRTVCLPLPSKLTPFIGGRRPLVFFGPVSRAATTPLPAGLPVIVGAIEVGVNMKMIKLLPKALEMPNEPIHFCTRLLDLLVEVGEVVRRQRLR